MRGIEIQYLFLIFGLIFSIIIVSTWQQMGTTIAEKRMGELKVNTITQIKNILFMLQYVPNQTQACASLMNCDKIVIHPTYIEIWGPANDYFKEEEYLSTSIVGNMQLYYYNETSKTWELLPTQGYVTTCGSGDHLIYICFKKSTNNNISIIKQEIVKK
ncbi:MAG TPA: hypothetical protein EYP80_02205 [Candidatus Aenigmarchaeota archaeon]|nr:hypothetical protein [Candidatus Aenigmarchaeota archaeon]